MGCAESAESRDDWIRELIGERDRLQGKKNAPEGATETAAPTGAPKEKVNIEDFELMTVVGKGSFGKVIQVRKKDTRKIYAMKVLNKKTIFDRGEVEHTKAEKNILQKLCHPFLVNLNYSFQTSDKLYFIMDYVNGGELFFHLQKDKTFTEERARFYCAEIVLGLEYLHNSGVLYRDLKPENLLLTSEGHICMTDFGISKEGLETDDDRTATFCGTPEYLAPEVVHQMYQQIMTAKLKIPSTVGSAATDLLEKLLVRDPNSRLTNPEKIKQHPWFSCIDWSKLATMEVTPPFIPPVKSKEDISQVDPDLLAKIQYYHLQMTLILEQKELLMDLPMLLHLV